MLMLMILIWTERKLLPLNKNYCHIMNVDAIFEYLSTLIQDLAIRV